MNLDVDPDFFITKNCVSGLSLATEGLLNTYGYAGLINVDFNSIKH